jgi:hypothetical protein
MDSSARRRGAEVSRWFVVAPERSDLSRHCYIRAEVGTLSDVAQIMGDVTLEVARKSIGEELFTAEMLAENPEHQRALDAWRAGDDGEYARDVAKGLLGEAAAKVEDLVSLAADETEPGELVHRYAESDEACRRLLELREVAATAERIVGGFHRDPSPEPEETGEEAS